MTTPTHTLTQIHTLQERYPFTEEELEILCRCHDHIKDSKDNEDFLMKLAHASPYSYYFLPGDELSDRVRWIEDCCLPAGFANEFRAAIAADAFVEYANQGEEKALERFIEGISDTGRRGTKEALRALYNTAGYEPTPEILIDHCVRLAVASDSLVSPNLDKDVAARLLNDLQPVIESLAKSLEAACDGKPLDVKVFTAWAEENFPMLPAPFSTFVHNLLFHSIPFPESRVPYAKPRLDHASDIFMTPNSPLLMGLSFTSQTFGGKWHRLYSSEMDGRSFNRLEWSLLGYSGPTLLAVKTASGATIGAFVTEPWKDSKDFYGSPDAFLIQLVPKLEIHRPIGREDKFMYLHSTEMHSSMDPLDECLPHGIGFGGNLTKPRLFIPASFEHCSADFLDSTFKPGDLLPKDALEKFEFQCLEVWGVGGDEVITQALRDRADYRERTDTAIRLARTVQDKSAFAADMQSGLIPNRLFSHQEQARGRSDFVVDSEHGGYRVEGK